MLIFLIVCAYIPSEDFWKESNAPAARCRYECCRLNFAPGQLYWGGQVRGEKAPGGKDLSFLPPSRPPPTPALCSRRRGSGPRSPRPSPARSCPSRSPPPRPRPVWKQESRPSLEMRAGEREGGVGRTQNSFQAAGAVHCASGQGRVSGSAAGSRPRHSASSWRFSGARFLRLERASAGEGRRQHSNTS